VCCSIKTKEKERVFYPSLASQVTASHLTPDFSPATLILFINAVSEVYYNNPNSELRFNESRVLIQKFIPITPMTLMTIIADSVSVISSPEIIRISLYYMIFSDFEKAFSTFLSDV
jgi:hypothetical protein